MNREDLLRMLDLAGKDAAPEDVTATTVEEAKTKSNAPSGAHLSHTALDLDEWALRRGKEVLEESERLRNLGLCEDAVADSPTKRPSTSRRSTARNSPPESG